MKKKLLRFLLHYVVFPSFLPLMLVIFLPLGLIRAATKKKILKWSEWCELYRIVSDAHENPIQRKLIEPDEQLVSKVWKLDSAKAYLGKLEWQKREGYCAPATMRCVLKSFPSFPTHLLPSQVSGPSNPEKWAAKIRSLMEEEKTITGEEDRVAPYMIRTEIFYGDEVGYDVFLEKLRKSLNQSNCRVAINFLRPALMGFKKPWWIPTHFFFGLFGGHFSPIIGILERSSSPKLPPLIAVFDVNVAYGMYLVEAPQLYSSIKGKDFGTGKSRAIIVLSEE